jgi:primosomal protein N' (replication factor Y)
MTSYAEVAVPVPVEGRFTYAIPDHLAGSLAIGHRVLVPFGTRKMTGFVLGRTDVAPELASDKVKSILECLDPEPLIPGDVLSLATFASEYYMAPIGEVLKAALPPGLTTASDVRLVATKLGRAFLSSGETALPSGEAISRAQRALLEACAKGSGMKGPKARTRAAAELRAMGLVADKEELALRASGREVEIVERAMTMRQAFPLIRRAPARRRIFELLDDGPKEVRALVEILGREAIGRALPRLEAEGIVARRQVPIAEWEGAPEAALLATGHQSLFPDQATALAAILSALDRRSSDAFLLHGVTGSGKTEVYLQAIAHARARGDGAIVLVPEIALTPQLEARFRDRFGDDVIVLHSAVADRERRRRWQRLRDGEARIALGPRSALWAPVERLGIVVVDEEHDASFKQGSDVRYNGRDLALVRARQAKAVAVLGSATPSLETLHLARTGRITELKLRVGARRSMPSVRIVDLTEERREMKGDIRLISRALEDGLREVVEKKEQAILFLNRRGFNTIVHCDDCGDARTCSRCDVSLTHHKSGAVLRCHYCDHVEPFAAPCRKCKGVAMRAFGAGTERVAELVTETIPGARVLRLDRDITSKAGALDATLDAFRSGEADILVGTQMVAKGHDFPRVTLVGILLADASLAIPEFRAAERTFQLVTQVAGRAGRADLPGRVVVQTFQPEHYALRSALDHDGDRFFEIELRLREGAEYPPFARLGLVRIESKDPRAAERIAGEVAAAGRSEGARIKGPAPAPIGKIKDRYRHLVMVLAPTPAKLSHAMRKIRRSLGDIPRSADLIFDIDALDLL